MCCNSFDVMTITAPVRATVSQALRANGYTKNQMAAALGVTPSWVTKFFNGKLAALDEEKADALEKFMNIKFERLVSRGQIPQEAVQLGEAMLTNQAVADIMGGLTALLTPRVIHELPFFETKELGKIGAEVTRIVHAWEQGQDPHYHRIGREVVEFLSKLAGKTRAAKKAGKKAAK